MEAPREPDEIATGDPEDEGLEGLIDRRIEVMSARGAPADEVMRLVETCRSRYEGWNVAHFYGWLATRRWRWLPPQASL